MSFLWPQLLWWMLAVPLLPLLYFWLLWRRRKQALRFSSLDLVREAADRRDWRRHVPPALLLIACALLLFAAARPTVPLTLPWARSTVVLAIDVSLSMRVTDVKPTRMAAAQEAAKLFLRDLPRNVEVALVTFASGAQVVQRATTDRAVLVSAIDAFQMQYGTAIGDAIVLCVAELFPDDRIDVPDNAFGPGHRPRIRTDKPPPKEITPVPPGSYDSAAIILLSDGRRTMGTDTLDAAKMAADRGVRIDVVGLGVVEGEAAGIDGLPIYMRLDEPTLREVARMTGGEYHHADTAEKLRNVYENLGSRLQVQTRETELAPLLALVAAILVLAAASLSFLWFGRPAGGALSGSPLFGQRRRARPSNARHSGRRRADSGDCHGRRAADHPIGRQSRLLVLAGAVQRAGLHRGRCHHAGDDQQREDDVVETRMHAELVHDIS